MEASVLGEGEAKTHEFHGELLSSLPLPGAVFSPLTSSHQIVFSFHPHLGHLVLTFPQFVSGCLCLCPEVAVCLQTCVADDFVLYFGGRQKEDSKKTSSILCPSYPLLKRQQEERS